MNLLQGKRENVFKLIIQKYEKRNDLIKVGAGEKEHCNEEKRTKKENPKFRGYENGMG